MVTYTTPTKYVIYEGYYYSFWMVVTHPLKE